MPRASPLQPSFSGGEFSPKLFGRTDSERYKTGLATCLNYLPTTQGPIVRRPGFKYVGNDVKDPAKPPNFLEFKFSIKQNYVVEIGDLYMRFYTNNGQITTSSTHFKVSGKYGTENVAFNSSNFSAMRTSPYGNPGETILASSVIVASTVLEINSPYAWPDMFDLKVAQKNDTLYITCSTYPEYKLQRFGSELWEMRRVNYTDGPYLPLNTYRSTADSARVAIITNAPGIIYTDTSADYTNATTGPVINITSCAAAPVSNYVRVTRSGHGYGNGDRVVVRGVVGTTEANNGTSSIAAMCWPVLRVDDNNFDLIGSAFTNAYVGSGWVYPALFEPYGSNTSYSDIGREIGLVRADGGRAWGRIYKVDDMSRFQFHVDSYNSPAVTTASGFTVAFWYMGAYSRLNGYPTSVVFHQDRKVLAGAAQYPHRVDFSVPGDYENYQPSGSGQIKTDASAMSFNLAADQLNQIYWMKSDAQGLLAGSIASEWNIAPNNQGAALTPTNVSAAQTSYFGSQNSDAVQTGNATLYIQRSGRRIRELNYFYQVNTYRSTDMAELSEHITNPSVTKLSVQKETIPTVWGLRTDGQLVSMVYNRDDVTLKVGWARHALGGRSDSGNSAPVVKSMAVIPSPDGTFDQLWCSVQRYINGTSVVNIEYMTKVFDDKTKQEDAFQVDCGGTYDNPLTVTGITTAGSAVVSVTAHGLANGDYLKINEVVGLNSSVVDVNGIIWNSNLVNAHTFVAGSVSVNAFFLQDFDGNYIDSRPYSVYVSGGEVRKLVSTISGLTWLKGETVAVLADGGIHPVTTVNSAGVLALSYPAAKVQIGYPYNSDGKTLRQDAGSGDGSAIGKMRKVSKVAFMLHQVGDFSIGSEFSRLTPLEFTPADVQPADTATPLYSGIVREGIESVHDFDGQVCFRQNSPLPGMVQTVTPIIEENDV